jgi:hypothetical protein
VAKRFAFRTPADREYLVLPAATRATFEEILPQLVRQPFRSGPGYRVGEIGGHPGLWKLRLTELPPRAFRAVYEVDGEIVRFLGFGPRPGFYRRLDQRNRLALSRR